MFVLDQEDVDATKFASIVLGIDVDKIMGSSTLSDRSEVDDATGNVSYHSTITFVVDYTKSLKTW